MLDAIGWTKSLLTDDGFLQNHDDGLPIDAISDKTAAGQAIKASARLIFSMLGKAETSYIAAGHT
jgi:hypothetical protein